EKAFRDGKFTILHKSPEMLLAMRRLVFNNDHQPHDLMGKAEYLRWKPAEDWAADSDDAPKVFRQRGASGEKAQWLRYQHLLVERSNVRLTELPREVKPQLIRNYMGYNTGEPADRRNEGRPIETNWVGDLSLDCAAQVDAQQGDLILELSKGPDRFRPGSTWPTAP